MRSDKYSTHVLRLERPSKQSEDQILFAKAVGTTIQTIYNTGLLVKYDKLDEVVKECRINEVKARRRPSLDQRGCTMSTSQLK